MKKIIFIISILTLVFIIYYLNLDKEVYFLSISDNTIINDKYMYQKTVDSYLDNKNLLEKSVIYYQDGDYRIIDLINDIEDNIVFNNCDEKYTLDNVLIKADIITLSIGTNDLLYNRLSDDDMYEYVDEVMKDLDKLFELIRKYSKENVLVFNFYSLYNDELVGYANKRLEILVNKYEFKLIDISDMKEIVSDGDYIMIGTKVIDYIKTIY